MNTSLIGHLFGQLPLWPEWAVLLIMFLLGGFLFQLWKAKQGASATGNGTPSAFNWRYFFADLQNWADFFGSLIAAYLFLRFMAPKAQSFDTLMVLTVGLGIVGQGLVDVVLEFFRGKNPFAKYTRTTPKPPEP